MSAKRYEYLWLFPIWLVILVSGCERPSTSGHSESSTNATTNRPVAATQAVDSNSLSPPAPVQPEEYHSVNPKEAGLSLRLIARKIEWNAKGWITTGDDIRLDVIDTSGHSMPIGLVSNRITDGQIHTKHFGIIKARSMGGFSMDLLMQDSELKELQRKLQESLNVKQRSPL